MKSVSLSRKTTETDISLHLKINGTGEALIKTPCGFLNHMLNLLAHHARLNLSITCTGDTEIDYHHSVEDIGICLGEALKQALGTKAGLTRYGDAAVPMDEALVLAAIDLSGRSCLVFDLPIEAQKIGDFDTELLEEFFAAFVRASGTTLHIKKLSGKNAHHIAECAFKAFARALRCACKIDEALGDAIASTKGTL